MSKRKQVEITKWGFRTVWQNCPHDRHMVNVDVYVDGDDTKPVIEWSYAKLKNGIAANAEFWIEQAIIQACSELVPQ